MIFGRDTPWEREALRVGFEGSQTAASLVQFRQAAIDLPENHDLMPLSSSSSPSGLVSVICSGTATSMPALITYWRRWI